MVTLAKFLRGKSLSKRNLICCISETEDCRKLKFGEVGLQQRWSRGHKARGQGQGQGHKKNPRPRPRPRTAFSRTDTLEAKDRNARGQGQGPRTQSASALQKKKKKKKVFTKIFQAISKKGLHKNFSGDLQKKKKKKKKKRSSQKFFKRSPRKNAFQKFFQPLHKILTFQKIVLSSSRGQANFRGLEASRPRPRPRTSKSVLEDSTSGLQIYQNFLRKNRAKHFRLECPFKFILMSFTNFRMSVNMLLQ